MTNDEKINYLYQTTNVLRQMLNAEVLPPPVEQNISDALVYLDCAKSNLMNEESIFKVVPTVVKKS